MHPFRFKRGLLSLTHPSVRSPFDLMDFYWPQKRLVPSSHLSRKSVQQLCMHHDSACLQPAGYFVEPGTRSGRRHISIPGKHALSVPLPGETISAQKESRSVVPSGKGTYRTCFPGILTWRPLRFLVLQTNPQVVDTLHFGDAPE